MCSRSAGTTAGCERSRRCSSSSRSSLLVAVLVDRRRRSTARGAGSRSGRPSFQPSELAKLALAIWAAATSRRRRAPRDAARARAAVRRCSARLFAVLLDPRARPRHGDRDRADARSRCCSSRARRRACSRRALAIAARARRRSRSGSSPTAARASSRSCTRGTTRRASGFQIVQAMIGMGSGGIFGVGLGQGVQKIFYLPEAPTDMMLANIGEELGLVGVAAVLARLPALRVRRPQDRARAAATRSASASPPG